MNSQTLKKKYFDFTTTNIIPNIFKNVFTCIQISHVLQLSLLLCSSAFYLLCFLNFYFYNYESVILLRYYYQGILTLYWAQKINLCGDTQIRLKRHSHRICFFRFFFSNFFYYYFLFLFFIFVNYIFFCFCCCL